MTNFNWMRLGRFAFFLTVVQLALLESLSSAAVKERFYLFGEEDPDAAIGGLAETTEDSIDSEQDAQGGLVPLTAFTESEAPMYSEGRDGPGSLSLAFDGSDDLLSSPAFDPRDFGTFTALSQGWVWPDPDGAGNSQFIWSLGSDNGGVGISSDGFWEMRAVSIVPDTVTTEPVAFGEWSHVSVLRTGGGANLYINGALVISGDGFWNGPGDVSVGAGLAGESPFLGMIDDFNLAGFSDGTFDLVNDLDFFDPDNFSGVLGDVDQDGVVNENDYLIWSESVGFDNGQGTGDATTLLMGDVNDDGRINYFDFQIISEEAANAGAPLNAVPEPAACVQLLIGGLIVFRSRIRRLTVMS